MTLQEKTNLLNIQYILEYLIEGYNEADCESEKYRIKLLLFDFIKDTKTSIQKLKDYMSLDSTKFEPFLKLLSNVIDDTQYDEEQSYDIEIRPQSICYVIRRQ